jgi:hypothetical protein
MKNVLKVLVLGPVFTAAVVFVLVCGLFFDLCQSVAGDSSNP